MRNEKETPSVGEIIKNFRTWRGYTQQELADYLNKSKSVISNWEHGTNSPDVDSCMKMCTFLNVSLNQLVGWEDNEEYEKFLQDQEEYAKEIDELRTQQSEIEERLKDLEKKKEEKVPRPSKNWFDIWNNDDNELPFN